MYPSFVACRVRSSAASPTRLGVRVAAAVLLLCGCSQDPVAGGEPAAEAAQPASAGPATLTGDRTVWFMQPGEQSLVAGWLGRAVRHPDGRRLRAWVINVTIPQSKAPWTGSEGPVMLEGVEPITMKNDLFELSVRPRAGRTWATVTERDQLEITTEGLY